MRPSTLISLFSLIVLLGATPATAADFSVGAQLGYMGGPGAELNAEVSSFAAGFPMGARLAFSYAGREPGVATDARRIFINDATNGTPTENGRFSALRFDLVYAMSANALHGVYLYAGPRYGSFTANFNFIGGNEDFDVNANSWGLGFGLEGRFGMGATTQFVLGGGGDYYPNAKLQGHDTSYAPDGETVNGRQDYVYNDADGAINQPKWEWKLVLGVNYLFGR